MFCFVFYSLGRSRKKANRWGKLEISWRQDEKKAPDSGSQQPGLCVNPRFWDEERSQISPEVTELAAIPTACWLFWALGIRRKTKGREGRNCEES